MKLRNKAGFTIIETMLFLGITGLLVMGVLVGASTSINIQRYRDSVVSLQSILQQQFSDVANVSNSYANNICNTVNIPRGQSDCMILGKYVTTANNGQTLITKRIISTATPNLANVSDDIVALKAYNIAVSSAINDTYDVEWGSSMVKQGGNNALSFSMLILKSPLSGVTRTFLKQDTVVADGSVATLIDSANLTAGITACVAPAGFTQVTKSAVYIAPNATNSNSIETKGEAMGNGC